MVCVSKGREELPPHTRRKDPIAGFAGGFAGTTSAYAEKSRVSRIPVGPIGNYLRIRGEKSSFTDPCRPHRELPPHTRRKVEEGVGKPPKYGTTSAYAEKSLYLAQNKLHSRNYLRIRGEKKGIPPHRAIASELPPHTRRKDRDQARCELREGTTSAYAEKSGTPHRALEYRRNYLRIRGEKFKPAQGKYRFLELPPHTRRKAGFRRIKALLRGTTSAYAEKRRLILWLCAPRWNYLRIRGEKHPRHPYRLGEPELPPHTRRKEVNSGDNRYGFGTTSAYAEKRVSATGAREAVRNYLRIRGEKG
ncbi:Hypothetical protein Cul210931_0032 [Corynebacterium ulcerans]|nr:Hypothetical protein Cul210931_0032 [Corynebacterium ulcerans]